MNIVTNIVILLHFHPKERRVNDRFDENEK